MHVRAVEASGLNFQTWLGHKPNSACKEPLRANPALQAVPTLEKLVSENYKKANSSVFDQNQTYWDNYYFNSQLDFKGLHPCLKFGSEPRQVCCLRIET